MEDHKNLNLGKKGEEVAAEYLKKKGYRILTQNFRVKGGELDIVAEKNGEIVFVEVRARSSNAIVSPAESITQEKRRRLRRAAEIFLVSKGLDLHPCRFDFIFVVKNNKKFEIEHLENVYI